MGRVGGGSSWEGGAPSNSSAKPRPDFLSPLAEVPSPAFWLPGAVVNKTVVMNRNPENSPLTDRELDNDLIIFFENDEFLRGFKTYKNQHYIKYSELVEYGRLKGSGSQLTQRCRSIQLTEPIKDKSKWVTLPCIYSQK